MLENKPARTPDDARALICELGRRFYDLGWVSGTGGGICIRLSGEHAGRVFMAPSGVQKELLTPDMIFELDLEGNVVNGPDPSTGLTVSQCRPLFLAAMQKRDAGAVIHGHGRASLTASMLAKDDRFTITEFEMLKGLAGVGYHDVHRVPVIENTAHECDLADSLSAAIDAEPKAHAVLVRRHGVYVWGRDWVEAKRHAECYDYLFAAAADLRAIGVDASLPSSTAPKA